MVKWHPSNFLSPLIPVSSDVAEKVCEILNINSRNGSEALKSMYGCLVMNVQGEDGVHKLQQIAATYDSGTNNSNGDGATIFVATSGMQALDLKLLLLDGDRYVFFFLIFISC